MRYISPLLAIVIVIATVQGQTSWKYKQMIQTDSIWLVDMSQWKGDV